MNALNFHFVAQMSVERLLNGVAEGMLIALFAWLLLRVIGQRNSGTRFALWFCALVAIALAPFVQGSSGQAVFHSAAVTVPRDWSSYLFAGWAAIALIGLARVAAGLWHLRSIRRDCVPLLTDPSGPAAHALALDSSLARSMQESGRQIELCVSNELRVPTAIGLLKPAVVIPSWALDELSQAELHAVILHEVAHLRRWDDWTNLAQKALRALFFFHPAVWWVENRLSLEREMACDDMVLAQTENPRVYAQCLVSLAEKNLLQRGIALAQAAVGRMRHTSLRVLQILDPRRGNSAAVWKPAPWVIAGFGLVCLATAAHAPRLVAFGDPAMPAGSSIASDIDSGYVTRMVPASYADRTSHTEVEKMRKLTAVHSQRSMVHFTTAKAASPSLHSAEFGSKAAAPHAAQAIHRSKAAQATPAIPLFRISATDEFPVVMMQQAVFVVTQDSYLGESVPVLWRLRVWQFVVLPQPSRPVEISSQSI